VRLSPLHPGALHGGDRVRSDEPVPDGLTERGTEDASDLDDRGGEASLLHPQQDRPDVVNRSRLNDDTPLLCRRVPACGVAARSFTVALEGAYDTNRPTNLSAVSATSCQPSSITRE
jgi:hypothetical protein